MKAKNTAITISVTLLAFLLGNYAASKFAKQQRVQQLLSTGECLDCDLSYLDLKSANLRGVDLSGANLEGSDLSGANLKGANLDRAILYKANLKNTYLADANFRRANLELANLEGADLGCSQLNLTMTEDSNGANLSLNFDRAGTASRGLSNFQLNFNLNEGSISFNLFGCPDFEAANLNRAILPDGSRY